MATIKDVARLAGVSVATVSRVINNSPKASEASRQSVGAAMETLNYHPNANARALAQQSTETVGLVVGDVSDPFFGAMVKAVEQVAYRTGNFLLIGNGYHNVQKERQAIEQLIRHRCAALALVSIDGAEKLSARESDAVMGQLVCFVANQWKKHFDRPAERVVCRLADSLFVIGCADKNCKELEEELHTLYGQMPHECVTSVGLMKMVPIPQSIAVACTSEVRGRNWEAVFQLCQQRLKAVQQAGGDQVSQS